MKKNNLTEESISSHEIIPYVLYERVFDKILKKKGSNFTPKKKKRK